MRISEAFAKMRLGEYCSNGDIDRAIAVTVDSFVGSQKVSAKKALARAFAKYTLRAPGRAGNTRGAGAGAGRGGRGVTVAA
jgi:DNA replication licensing factor MCM2